LEFSRVLGDALSKGGSGLLHEKLKVLERFGKEREKNMKKTLSRRKGCLEVCLASLFFHVVSGSGIIKVLL